MAKKIELQLKILHSGQVCVKVSSLTILILAYFPLRRFFFLFLKAQFGKKKGFGVSSQATRE